MLYFIKRNIPYLCGLWRFANAYNLFRICFGSNKISFAEEIEEINVDEFVHQKAVSLLQEGYKNYYEFTGSKATLCCRHNVDSKTQLTFLLEVNATLLAEKVEDLDYFQGILSYFNIEVDEYKTYSKEKIESLISKKNNLKNETYNLKMLTYIDEVYNNLEQYINKEQILTFYAKATYGDNYSDLEILFENGYDYCKAEAMYPKETILKSIGHNHMQEVSEKVSKNAFNADSLMREKSSSFSITFAMIYACRYTSNPTKCDCGSSSCVPMYDASKWNSSYSKYPHSDCANFVSQVLNAGLLPTDSNWFKDSSAWINVSSFKDYMLNKGYLEIVDASQAKAGTVLSFNNESHVAIITSFDGVTYKYSGHTRDRLNATINLGSNVTCYNVIY